jgi:hypothetical protein
MSEKVTGLIMYGSENHSLDFKELQYPITKHAKKNELLKDISAMANLPNNEDKYIIVGVKEENGVATGFCDILELVDEAKYQQFINSNIEPPINFEYKKVCYEGFQLAFFRIYNNVNRPYLFKKDLNNPANHERNEFRKGDGYIRQGTSTKKITREDLELIYTTRFKARDRKGDLKIIPHICDSEDEEINSFGLLCFDLTIENTSSKSIELDLEVNIQKTGTVAIIAESELKKEIDRKRNEERKRKDPHSFFVTPNVHFSFDVTVEETESHVVASRNIRRGEKTAITIPQHAKENNALCQTLVILGENSGTIKGEIVVRSDDFSEGALVYPFSIEYPGLRAHDDN